MTMTHATTVAPRHTDTGFLTRLARRIDEAFSRARTREMLMRLDDRMLRDIGLTRCEAMFGRRW